MSRTRKKGVWICVMLVAMLLALCGGGERSGGLCGRNGDAHHGNGFDDDDGDRGSSVE